MGSGILCWNSTYGFHFFFLAKACTEAASLLGQKLQILASFCLRDKPVLSGVRVRVQGSGLSCSVTLQHSAVKNIQPKLSPYKGPSEPFYCWAHSMANKGCPRLYLQQLFFFIKVAAIFFQNSFSLALIENSIL